ncbi:alkaline phosphatase D family protein [Arsenicicoccus sp. UBA7492]|uniref:alkaline phosphatase D family protein n=1 Tax=Arsenicicoccus sp. UBA7492 TaxID=1946057 RepID=UPI002579C926|nr:alkaline phosphatase D family protein [Arsenicicoccus sp. UBA7492]
MANVSRRSLLTGALGGAGLVALGQSTSVAAGGSPALVRGRSTLPSGVQAGDVTSRSAVVWSRSDRPGRMVVRLTSGGRRGSWRELAGPWATPRSDLTAKLELKGLAPGRDYEYRVQFEDLDGHRGEVGVGHLSTAAVHDAPTSFVWTGDTAGQGWGINPDLGGMVAYRAMHELRPDFLIHSGDNIYADGPIQERVVEPDGQVWRNVVTPQVAKVAESLDEFRGRYRYNLMDKNLRGMYADVPVISQWDDHETTNNWYPGEVLDDPRYARERRVDVLATRARQAFFEFMPIADRHGRGVRDLGQAPRVYRKVERGAHLDVFSLDMRTYRGANTPSLEKQRTAFLGTEQVDWLLRELQRSRATWKVIAADMPIGIIVPDGTDIEAIANRDPGAPLGRELELAYLLSEIKRRKIRGVVWFTADVHYCAAHYYDPAKAAFTDFDGFHEFVAGPISAGGFGPNQMDATFGPQVLFQGVPRHANQSPRDQRAMFFGYTEVDRAGTMTVSLRNGLGQVLYTKELAPQGH